MNFKSMIKKRTAARASALLAASLLAFGATASARASDKGCSLGSLYGTFAYTSTGSLVGVPAGPYAEVGTQTFDGHGGVTGAGNISLNGNIIPMTFTGTYTVNQDCTGTFAVAIAALGFTAHYGFAIDDTENGFQALCLDSGAVINRVARRQFAVTDWRR